MKRILCLLFALTIYLPVKIFAQSMNCATATSMNLSSGSDCVSGTNVGAVSDNILYGACNSSPVDMVWYTYVTNGSNNTFTVTPGTLTNPEIVIYLGGCPSTPSGTLQTCATAAGSTPLTTTWGMTAGIQVWVGIASTSLNDGTFQLCVNSTPPVAGAGNTCSQAIPICNTSFSQANIPSNSSGQSSSCFGSPPQEDIWIQFTVTQSGTLAWTATPNSAITEFDWCLWDISAGCPGVETCCNYDYAGSTGAPFGMQNVVGNVACGYNGFAGGAAEFSPTMAVTCGKVYAIQISNYSNDNTGFSLAFTNSTCMISSNAAFVATPTLVCGASLTAAIANSSTGDCAEVWNYGDGSATYTGGAPPNHTYSTPGTYAITATIGGACPSTATQFVELLAPLAATVASTSITCLSICTGSASVTSISGGDGIYTYTWNPGGSTNTDISSLCAGTYSLTVHNAKCGTTITETVNVVAPPALTLTATPTNITCTSTGGITTTVSGGTSPYTYSWTGPSAYSSTTQNPTGLTTAGIYSLTVTDNNSCTYTATANVAQTGSITVSVNSPTVCAGGAVTLTAAGATTYSWNTGATTNPITVTPGATSYTVIGTTGSCTNTAVATVTVIPNPTVTVNSATICPGASTTLTATGATTYSWNTGATTAAITESPGATTSYTVTGTTNTCTNTAVATVTIGGSISPTVNSATICNGNSTTLTVGGATTYTWSPGTGLSATTGASVTANPVSTTTYTITGATGACTGTVTSVVTVNPIPVVTASSTSVCAGSAGTITAGGATTYSWNTGETTATVTELPATTTSYTVTGTDANSCTNTAVGTVTVVSNPTVTVNNPTICTGGTATLTANGATTYSWSTSETTNPITVTPPTGTTSYTVIGTTNTCTNTAVATVTVVPSLTVTSSSTTICAGAVATLTASGAATYSWNTGATTNTLSISPGATTTYTVVGTAGTCSASGTGVVTVNTLPIVTANTATICIGQQTATLTASGAATYTWNPSATLSSNTGTTVTGTPTTTTSYVITGTDANGCINTGTTSITVNTLPTITATSGTICVGQQTATLTANGASTYVWTPTTGLTPTTGSVVAANPPSTQNYTITGTDVNGCINTGTTSVVVNSLPNITSTSTSVCPTFAGTITASGANTYTWNTAATGAALTQTPAATTSYTVTGTDSNGCTDTSVGTITVFPTLSVTVNSSTICVGQQTATLSANGAVNYAWNPTTGLTPTTGSVVIANPAATTVYTVTGSVGTCSATATATVLVNSLPTITSTSSTICVGEQTATLTASGAGTGSYSWTPATGLSSNTGSVVTGTPNATQTYTVTGTDANGCISTGVGAITVNSLPNITTNTSTICVGQQSATLTAGGAVTYTWTPSVTLSSNTGTTVTGTPTTTTNYTITGTDGNGCKDSTTTSIAVNNLPLVTSTSYTICVGQQTATLTAGGAVTYTWNPAVTLSSNTGTTVTGTPTTTTHYTVTGTDANGCTDTASTNIVVNPLPLPIPTSNTPCANQTLTLTCTPNGLTNYNWAGPNSYSVSSTQNPVITGVTASTAGIYTVFVTDVNSCTNTNTVTVIVNPLPVVSAAGSTVCVNQTITLSCLPNLDTYSWSGQAGAFTSSSQNPTIPNATATMSGVYVVTITDGNGCINASVAQVLVNPLPIISATSSTICTGQQTATLTASGGITYTWTPSATLNSSTGTTVLGVPVATTIYTVTGTDANGCKDTATTHITVLALPVIVTNTISPDCIPLCAVFTATSTPTASTYTWNFGNGQSSTQPSPTECYSVSGTYNVMLNVTDINGCKGAANAITVTAFSIPVADFEYGQQPVSILAPEVNFTNLSTPGLPHYNWNFGDIYGSATTNTSTVTNPSHVYQDTGTYYVTLTVSTISGCSASVTKPILINEMFALYVPNAFSPNADGKNEIFLAEGEGIIQFKMFIFDRWGLLIYYSDDINKGWDGTYIGKGPQILQEDVYVWKIQATDMTNTPRNLHGTVTLLK